MRYGFLKEKSVKFSLQGSPLTIMKGFTIIELIIYIGIVAGILLVFFNFGWEVVYGDVKSQTIREVQQNSRFTMEKITESILSASGINTPLNGNFSDSLSLEMQDLNLTPTVFEVSDGRLIITQGSNTPYQLTNNRVRVSSLQFSNLSYENTPGTIRSEMTIEYFNPANLNQYEASLSTENTVSLRK